MKYLIVCAVFAIVFAACKKTPEGVDGEIFELSEETTGFVWYKNSDDFLNKSAGSGHDFPFLKTRFNSAAATQLNGNGMVVEGAVFPEGSVIVKELFDDKEKFKRYASLWKNSVSPFADSDGWVWGYIDAKGKVVETAENKGQSCIGCHSQAGNIDKILMNKFFP